MNDTQLMTRPKTNYPTHSERRRMMACSAWYNCHPGETIPSGFDVHHLDGNPNNNSPENLVLIEHGFHEWLHGTNSLWDYANGDASLMRDSWRTSVNWQEMCYIGLVYTDAKDNQWTFININSSNLMPAEWYEIQPIVPNRSLRIASDGRFNFDTAKRVWATRDGNALYARCWIQYDPNTNTCSVLNEVEQS